MRTSCLDGKTCCEIQDGCATIFTCVESYGRFRVE